MKRGFVVQIFFLWLGLTASVQAKPPYAVDAYLATTFVNSSRGVQVQTSGIPWNDITALYEFAGQVNSDGSISFIPSGVYNNLTVTAHANNTRVFITFGGANSDAAFGAATSSNMAGLVSNIMAIVTQYKFDGVNIDWEFPSAAEESQFMTLMQNLSSSLRAQMDYQGNPKGIDFFGSGGAAICGVNWATIGSYVDEVILSGYDYYATVGGVTYDGPVLVPAGNNYGDCAGRTRLLCSSDDISMINSLGFPISQMVLGCPLYVDDSSQDDVYSVIQNGTFVSTANPSEEMESVYSYNGSQWGTNDEAAFCDKITWATKTQGMKGIGLWEMSQAYPTSDTPVAAIWNVIGGNDPCLNLGTPTPSPTPPIQSTWRVNAGGPAYTDAHGNLWSADENYSGGTAAGPSTVTVTNTSDPTLYQTQRYGTFSYAFNVPAGSYQVSLLFAETYWTAAGQRVFNVSINGSTVLNNFDIFASSGGENIALNEVFNNISPSGGQIVINFGPASANYAEVQAIQIIPEPSPSPTSTLTPSPSATLSPPPSKTATSSPSPSFTRSASPSATSNSSASPSSSPTPTPSLTSTLTSTRSATATASLTPSTTLSPRLSPTQSPSPSPLASLTPSPTANASASASPTLSATESYPSPSPSLSPTRTLSLSASPSLTSSPSPSLTRSQSPTLSMSPSPSLSPTWTFSLTASPSLTSSPSSTRSLSPTLSMSPSPSLSPTWTFSLTASPSLTSSPSSTRSLSPTLSMSPSPNPSPSPSLSSTPTTSPSPKLSVTSSPTMLVTVSPSPSPEPIPSPSSSPKIVSTALGGGGGQVQKVLPVPNPQSGPQFHFAFLMNGPTDYVDLSVFSVAMVLRAQERIYGPWSQEWGETSVILPELGNGIYYVLLKSGDGGPAAASRLAVYR